MSNGVSAVLAVIQKDVLGLHKAVEMTNGGFNRMHLAVAGLAGVAFGGAMLGGLYELSRAGEKYTHQLELMKIAGMNVADMRLAISAANSTSSQVMSSSPTENLQMIGELRSVFGSTDDAVKFLPQIAQYGAVLHALTGATPEKLGYTTMRAVEMMGGTVNTTTGQMDLDKAHTMVDLITQASIQSHGMVDPNAWVAFAQTASAVVKKMDQKALILGMMPFIQEMGGHRAGTALTSMNAQIVGGVMPQRTVADWIKFGLIDPTKITPTKTGVRVAPGAVVGEEIWKKNPLEWIESVFIPKLEKRGVKEADISDQIIRLFSRQTSQREASLMATQLIRVHKDVALAGQSATAAPGAKELLANDPDSVRMEVAKQWGRLLTSIGTAMTPSTVSLMTKLASGLSWMAEAVEKHPTATKWILGIAAGLGVLLVVAGTVAIAAAAIGAVIGSTVGLIAAAAVVGIAEIAAFWTAIYTYWDDIIGFIRNGLSSIGSAIKDWIGSLWDFVKSPFASGKPAEMPADWKPAHVGNPGSLSQRLHDSAIFQANIASMRQGIANDVKGSVGTPANSNNGGVVPPGGLVPPPAASYAKSGLSDDQADRIGGIMADKLNGAEVSMDGRKVGKLLFADSGLSPPSGASNFDSRMSPLYPATGMK